MDTIKYRHRPSRKTEDLRPEGHRRSRVIGAGADSGHILAMKEFTQQLDIDIPGYPKGSHQFSPLPLHKIIDPPYNMMSLVQLKYENNALSQCIEAMVSNVEGHGWDLHYTGPEDMAESQEVAAERSRVMAFLDNPNGEYSLEELNSKCRSDEETTGNSYREVGRTSSGNLAFLFHVPSHTMRITTKDTESTPIYIETSEGKVPRSRQFRRYVQIQGTERAVFKEYGDPRSIDRTDGSVLTASSVLGATEILHCHKYSAPYLYGLPSWINQLPSILGSRQAELTNLDYFKENAVPALMVLVSGGALTQASINEIEDQLTQARGRKSLNRVAILEAVGDARAASMDGSIPPPKVEIQPLSEKQRKDGMFLEYDADCRSKIRQSMRMPKLFVGDTDDYNYSTAKAAFEVAESQVFGAARRKTESLYNRHILPEFGVQWHTYRMMPPRISDPSEIVESLRIFNQMGAMTPNVAIGLANETFGLSIDQVPSSEKWGDIPFQLTVVNESRLDTVVDDEDDPSGDLPDDMPTKVKEAVRAARMAKMCLRELEDAA